METLTKIYLGSLVINFILQGVEIAIERRKSKQKMTSRDWWFIILVSITPFLNTLSLVTILVVKYYESTGNNKD